jgi:pyruvate kinase
MIIRTKILATVGPVSGSPKAIRSLVQAGCDAFRINFSHGSDEQHAEFLHNIRSIEQELGQPIAVCADLCGPKIRVGLMAGGGVLLAEGQELVIQRQPIEGTATRISTTLAELVDDVHPGDMILLDDGKMRMEVVRTAPPDEVVCRVVVGGILGSGKGVNLPHTQLRLSALTEKDRRDVAWLAGRGFDYVALSFVQRADDINTLRDLLRDNNCDAHIIAKVEKPQALEQIDEIIQAADMVMVARGDLGVEMDFPAVPVAQKQIAHACQQAGKPCIIATQMLDSMIHSPTPTRAEVSDVANAVLDHADAVMLSGETAVGEYPVQTVTAMNSIVAAMQSYHDQHNPPTHVACEDSPTTAAIAGAVREIIAAENIATVAVFTATGATARMLSKNRLPCPILAMSPDISTVRRMCLYYGVTARQAEAPTHTREVLKIVSQLARDRQVAASGDRIVVISGRPIGQPGRSNTIVVHTIGE